MWTEKETEYGYRLVEAPNAPTLGYGYDDIGRDTLAAIWADLFGADDLSVGCSEGHFRAPRNLIGRAFERARITDQSFVRFAE